MALDAVAAEELELVVLVELDDEVVVGVPVVVGTVVPVDVVTCMIGLSEVRAV